jgi:hypothetical protein
MLGAVSHVCCVSEPWNAEGCSGLHSTARGGYTVYKLLTFHSLDQQANKKDLFFRSPGNTQHRL